MERRLKQTVEKMTLKGDYKEAVLLRKIHQYNKNIIELVENLNQRIVSRNQRLSKVGGVSGTQVSQLSFLPDDSEEEVIINCSICRINVTCRALATANSVGKRAWDVLFEMWSWGTRQTHRQLVSQG